MLKAIKISKSNVESISKTVNVKRDLLERQIGHYIMTNTEKPKIWGIHSETFFNKNYDFIGHPNQHVFSAVSRIS